MDRRRMAGLLLEEHGETALEAVVVCKNGTNMRDWSAFLNVPSNPASNANHGFAEIFANSHGRQLAHKHKVESRNRGDGNRGGRGDGYWLTPLFHP